MLRKKVANKDKVWAYKDKYNQEIILGNTIYLGKNDDESRYYEVDDPLLNEDNKDTVSNNT